MVGRRFPQRPIALGRLPRLYGQQRDFLPLEGPVAVGKLSEPEIGHVQISCDR